MAKALEELEINGLKTIPLHKALSDAGVISGDFHAMANPGWRPGNLAPVTA